MTTDREEEALAEYRRAIAEGDVWKIQKAHERYAAAVAATEVRNPEGEPEQLRSDNLRQAEIIRELRLKLDEALVVTKRLREVLK